MRGVAGCGKGGLRENHGLRWKRLLHRLNGVAEPFRILLRHRHGNAEPRGRGEQDPCVPQDALAVVDRRHEPLLQVDHDKVRVFRVEKHGCLYGFGLKSGGTFGIGSVMEKRKPSSKNSIDTSACNCVASTRCSRREPKP